MRRVKGFLTSGMCADFFDKIFLPTLKRLLRQKKNTQSHENQQKKKRKGEKERRKDGRMEGKMLNQFSAC